MGVTSQQSFRFRLVANDTQLDTFDDEVITVSNNVTGLFDVGLLPSDFTRQITIPGTKKNNQFFISLYNDQINLISQTDFNIDYNFNFIEILNVKQNIINIEFDKSNKRQSMHKQVILIMESSQYPFGEFA